MPTDPEHKESGASGSASNTGHEMELGPESATGQYRIGPFTVTPSGDESGLMAYMVGMQAGLEEAVHNLHQKEMRINEITSQITQLSEEKTHMSVKLNSATRSLHDNDKRLRVAEQDAKHLKVLQQEDPRKVASEARKRLADNRKLLVAAKEELVKENERYAALDKEKSTLEARVDALEQQLEAGRGRYRALEEQREAVQAQVAALTWKLKAFEQQYAALYQQYSAQLNTGPGTREEPDIPQTLPPPPPPPTQHDPGTSHEALREQWSDSGAAFLPLESSDMRPLLGSGENLRNGTDEERGHRYPAASTLHRRRKSPYPPWFPEWLANRLALRPRPPAKALFTVYILILHVYLVFFCLLAGNPAP